MSDDKDWRGHILAEIRWLREANEKQNELILEMTKELARIEVKSSIFGIVGGMIPVVLGFLALLLKSILFKGQV